MHFNKGNQRLRKGRAALVVLVLVLLIGSIIFYWMVQNPIRFVSMRPRVELGSQYEIMDNVRSVFLGDKKDVKASGSVNTLLTGEYEIDYNYKSRTWPVVVVVEDTTGPALTLKDVKAGLEDEVDAESFIVSCKDPSRVSLSINNPEALDMGAGTFVVEISAMDEFGNKTVKSARLIRQADVLPPEVLSQPLPRTFMVGEEFYPAELDVADDQDADLDITWNTSQLDLNTPGEYKVTYVIKDESGNSATVSETIFVEESRQPSLPEVNGQ